MDTWVEEDLIQQLKFQEEMAILSILVKEKATLTSIGQNLDGVEFIGRRDYYNSPKDFYTACHYTECRTTDNSLCSFPFRYKGRSYSSCITIDSPHAWCSLTTDRMNNHIGGENTKGKCSDACLIQNCPIGFFRQNNNCYHISGTTTNDVITNNSAAEKMCHGLGSRLYQPRSYKLHEDLLISNKGTFESLFYSQTAQPQFLTLGARAKDYPSTKQILYNDGTRAYFLESVAAEEGLTSLTISDMVAYSDYACIFITNEGILQMEKCADYDTPLGYICEAKSLITIEGEVIGKSCHFPFYQDDNKAEVYHSCIYNETARYSWCFTELNSEDVGVPGKTGLCPDEREITYKGPGSGKQCDLPFLSDRVWYDSCALDPKEEIWCPTILSDPKKLFDEQLDEYAYCTGYLGGASASCNTNYDAIDGKCIRVSPFPESFEAASAKCRSEGSYLLSILDPSVIPPIKVHIEKLSSTRIQFLPIYSPDISSYWVGGHVNNDLWTWQANGKNFSKYSNWIDNKINAGCIQNICTSNYKLTVQVAKDYSWKAVDETLEKPYICESSCKAGYLWYRSVKKCLKVVSNIALADISEAMVQCAKDKARLASFSTCEEAKNLPIDFKRILTQSSDRFWIGIFSKGVENFKSRRSSENTMTSRPILRSDGYASVEACAELPDATNSEAEVGVLVYEKPDISLEYAVIDSTDRNGYICEQDNDWVCPEGYMLFHEDCYKVFTSVHRFTDAHLQCKRESGMLISVNSDFLKLFLLKILNQNDIVDVVWTGYRKNPSNIATAADEIYHSYLGDIFTQAGISGT